MLSLCLILLFFHLFFIQSFIYLFFCSFIFLCCFLFCSFFSLSLCLVGWFYVWAELQVACQSAVSQEQVEGMLSENDALRTNLAALEQVPDPDTASRPSSTPVPATSSLSDHVWSNTHALCAINC